MVALVRCEMLNEDIRHDADRDGIEERGGAGNPEPGELSEHTENYPHRAFHTPAPISPNLLSEIARITKLIFLEPGQPDPRPQRRRAMPSAWRIAA